MDVQTLRIDTDFFAIRIDRLEKFVTCAEFSKFCNELLKDYFTVVMGYYSNNSMGEKIFTPTIKLQESILTFLTDEELCKKLNGHLIITGTTEDNILDLCNPVMNLIYDITRLLFEYPSEVHNLSDCDILTCTINTDTKSFLVFNTS